MEYAVAFILLVAYLYTTFVGDKDYKIFTKLKKTAERQYYYKRWVWQAWVFFGLIGVVSVLTLGDATHLFRPLTHTSLSAFSNGNETKDDSSSFYAGLAIGLALAAVILAIRIRRSLHKRMAIGNTDALVPRNVAERKQGALLALSAGINEELFFRAAIPATVFAIANNVTIAVAVSVVLFGFAHIYQGWKGVLATAVVGWVFMKAFMLSGTILAPMAIHIALDMWGLVVVPYIMAKTSKN